MEDDELTAAEREEVRLERLLPVEEREAVVHGFRAGRAFARAEAEQAPHMQSVHHRDGPIAQVRQAADWLEGEAEGGGESGETLGKIAANLRAAADALAAYDQAREGERARVYLIEAELRALLAERGQQGSMQGPTIWQMSQAIATALTTAEQAPEGEGEAGDLICEALEARGATNTQAASQTTALLAALAEQAPHEREREDAVEIVASELALIDGYDPNDVTPAAWAGHRDIYQERARRVLAALAEHSTGDKGCQTHGKTDCEECYLDALAPAGQPEETETP